MDENVKKSVFIAEKPSVAREFAKVLNVNGGNKNGYIENDKYIITWCVGHLVTMSYPEVYDSKLKKWRFDTLPFLPKEWKYEVIDAVKSQFEIVKNILNREDVSTIYICTDSGREGEYIYRLVDMMAEVKDDKVRKRVWIDSQTEEEILKGIKNAKDWSNYDNLSDSAYLRAKEDYLMGINFSRALTLKYGYDVKNYLKRDKPFALSVGRVMTCVLGMIVNREREIRNFRETEFYRVISKIDCTEDYSFNAEWKVSKESKYYNHPDLYKENGFVKRERADELIEGIKKSGHEAEVMDITRKTENKNAPLLFNLAELQNECSKLFKISPDETLKVVQELYEKKCVTYPRTDARVLSTAIAKEIEKNIKGISTNLMFKEYCDEIINSGSYKNIEKSRYTNDKKITDHYAIIPTGAGLNNLNTMPELNKKVYEVIVRRFLSIFYPPAKYSKMAVELMMPIIDDENKENSENNDGEKTYKERFNSSFKVLVDEGYLKVTKYSFMNKNSKDNESKETDKETDKETGKDNENNNENDKAESSDIKAFEILKKIKKNDKLNVGDLFIKEGKTTPPKRYNSGNLILAMENAGQLIEDEELREQIKGSGIGTSATRAEILKKLINIKYLALNKKTQIITPTFIGEIVYEVVLSSIKHLLNPELTASWEKGLTMVAEGAINKEEYMEKLEGFVSRRTNAVKKASNHGMLIRRFNEISVYYK